MKTDFSIIFFAYDTINIESEQSQNVLFVDLLDKLNVPKFQNTIALETFVVLIRKPYLCILFQNCILSMFFVHETLNLYNHICHRRVS